MQIFLQDSAFNSSKYTLRSGSVGSHGTSIFVKESLYNFSLVAYQFTFPQAVHKDSLTPQLHQHLLHLVFFYEIHSNWCKVISHCGFDLHSLMISDVEHFFMHFFTIYMSSWGKCLFSFSIHFSLSLFFFYSIHFLIGLFVLLLLNCMSSVCVWILTPYEIHDLQILFYSLDCLFIFVHCCFAVKKLFSVTQSHLLIFAIIA